jgi:amidase
VLAGDYNVVPTDLDIYPTKSWDRDALLQPPSRAAYQRLLAQGIFITPTLTQKPRPLGYYDMSETDLDRFNALWSDGAFMFPFNMSGQPAISLPLHWSPEGDPIGVQLVGRFGDEATLLSMSSVLEHEMPWRDRKPPICA